MTQINKNIRWYQPNDPYYYEVDNLPLTDLLNNDVVLETRLEDLEDAFKKLGESSPSGSVALGAIKDLKGFTTEAEAGKIGRVFVQPGSFIARMSLPADIESGWRMLGDESSEFNNESGTSTTALNTNAAKTKMVARTAVVTLEPDASGYPQGVRIPNFDPGEFNEAAPPDYRLDLLFVRARVSYDRNKTESIETDIGVLKGAGYRTDSQATVDQTTGARFRNYPNTQTGRMTGMDEASLVSLPGYGSVPLPEDLINFEFKNESTVILNGEEFALAQLNAEASFCLPIAYVKVPMGHNELGILRESNLIDIRPFLRTAELTYGERAAISRAVNPNGSNPFTTVSHVTLITSIFIGALDDLTTRVAALEGWRNTITAEVIALDAYVKGMGLTAPGNHDGRIDALEIATGGGTGGGIGAVVEETKHVGYTTELTSPGDTWAVSASQTFTLAGIPQADRAKTAYVWVRFHSPEGDILVTPRVYLMAPLIAQTFPQINHNEMWLFSVRGTIMSTVGDFLCPVTYDSTLDVITLTFYSPDSYINFPIWSNRENGAIWTGAYVIKTTI